MTKTTKYSSCVVQTPVYQIQDGGWPPFWKVNKSLYLSNGLIDRHKSWQSDVHWPSELSAVKHYVVPPVKISVACDAAFRQSSMTTCLHLVRGGIRVITWWFCSNWHCSPVVTPGKYVNDSLFSSTSELCLRHNTQHDGIDWWVEYTIIQLLFYVSTIQYNKLLLRKLSGGNLNTYIKVIITSNQ